MIVWRLERAVHDPLSAEGARLASGRWNPEGVPMVYTSSQGSLAVLEKLVHVDPDLLPDDLTLCRIELPEDGRIEAYPTYAMPADWRSIPPTATTQAIGATWARDLERPGVLSVPSVLLPAERNLLLNPRHSDAAGWRVIDREPFAFDPRLIPPRRY